MARDNLKLQPNEAVIYQSVGVTQEGVRSGYTGELILTNYNIIYIGSKGLFGNSKEVQKYPLKLLKMYNNHPQAIVGMMPYDHNHPQLELYFTNGAQINFAFQSKGKKEILKWIDEICIVLTGHPSSVVAAEKMSVPGMNVVADKLKGTINAFKNSFGTDPKEFVPQTVTVKCAFCRAPLSGNKGEVVICRYCDSEQTL